MNRKITDFALVGSIGAFGAIGFFSIAGDGFVSSPSSRSSESRFIRASDPKPAPVLVQKCRRESGRCSAGFMVGRSIHVEEFVAVENRSAKAFPC